MRLFGKHFLTGEKAGRKSVEDLKRGSAKDAEVLWEVNQALRKEQLSQLGRLLESKKARALVSEALKGETYVNRERTR